MSAKPETVFWNRIRPKLLALPHSWWEKIQQVSKRGTPDVIGCVRGTFFALELKKSSKDKPSPLQYYVLDQVNKASGVALVINPENWDFYYNKIKLYAEGVEDVI